MELIRLPAAARELGISYPTLKQWIYRRRVRSVKTAGGHHRIPRTEIDRLLFQGGPGTGRAYSGARAGAASRFASESPRATTLRHFVSGRNQLVGRVIEVRTAGLLAKVSLDIGGQIVTAIITREACRDLGLKPGVPAAALIKATEVMIIGPPTGKVQP